MNLESKISESLRIFDQLDKQKSYTLAFSGGKDSHVILSLYFDWLNRGNPPLNLQVVFADTLLEVAKLYTLVDEVEQACQHRGVTFQRAKRPIEKDFWVLLFGLGYPVPDYRNRWCTKYLKVNPVGTFKGIPITGAHYGESKQRDKRLNCSTGECGISDLKQTIEPIKEWFNCDVWDYIILYMDSILYPEASKNLLNMYEIAENTNGSLRMGCFMCPVVKEHKIIGQVEKGIVPPLASIVRRIIEKLRSEPRINNPRTKKAGSILVDSRIKLWAELAPHFEEMVSYGWISAKVIETVNQMLLMRTYPPTYKQDWIKSEESRIGGVN